MSIIKNIGIFEVASVAGATAERIVYSPTVLMYILPKTDMSQWVRAADLNYDWNIKVTYNLKVAMKYDMDTRKLLSATGSVVNDPIKIESYLPHTAIGQFKKYGL